MQKIYQSTGTNDKDNQINPELDIVSFVRFCLSEDWTNKTWKIVCSSDIEATAESIRSYLYTVPVDSVNNIDYDERVGNYDIQVEVSESLQDNEWEVYK